MQNRKLVSFVAMAVLLLGLNAVRAKAGTVTDSSGVVYNLTYVLVSSTASTQTYDITLAADTTGYKAGSGTNLLVAAAVKAADDGNVTSEKLLSAPSAAWSIVDGGTNSGGCKASSTNGFDCAKATPFTSGVGVGKTKGGTFDWTWQLVIKTGDLFTAADAASIKAVYYNSTGTDFEYQTSVDVTDTKGLPPVPEPASLALMGTALVGASILLRKQLGGQAS